MPLITNFEFNGVIITDPFSDETMMGIVDPVEYYAEAFEGKTLWAVTKEGMAITSAVETSPEKLIDLDWDPEDIHLVIKSNDNLPYYSNS